MEIWKDIENYEGLYQVSNLGNIKSLDRYVVYKNGSVNFHEGKLRTPSFSEYRMIVLSKNGKLKTIKISRIVASHFLLNIKDKKVVNHIDGNKYNDNFNNLEYVNHSENNIHSFQIGLSKKVNKVAGVFYDKNRKKWASYLYRNNKNIFIGRFETEKEAVEKRQIIKDGIYSKY